MRLFLPIPDRDPSGSEYGSYQTMTAAYKHWTARHIRTCEGVPVPPGSLAEEWQHPSTAAPFRNTRSKNCCAPVFGDLHVTGCGTPPIRDRTTGCHICSACRRPADFCVTAKIVSDPELSARPVPFTVTTDMFSTRVHATSSGTPIQGWHGKTACIELPAALGIWRVILTGNPTDKTPVGEPGSAVSAVVEGAVPHP